MHFTSISFRHFTAMALLSCTGLLSCSKEGIFSDGYIFEDVKSPGFNPVGQDSIPDNLSGKVTAGEWNDLDNWDFWTNLLSIQDSTVNYFEYPKYWKYDTGGRIPFLVLYQDRAAVNAQLVLKQDDRTLWTARSDIFGRAELWAGLSPLQPLLTDLTQYTLEVDGEDIPFTLRSDTLNILRLDHRPDFIEKVELAFIVDATGSMSDELEFLKADLEQVIIQASQKVGNPISTGAVFYRDEGDEYVVRHCDMTTDLHSTVQFIAQQSAQAGGDYPEAVHTALQEALSELQWTPDAKTKLAFLILDAPPHYTEPIVNLIHEQVMRFAAQGIKLIPVASSGIDKETEFLLRYFAMATNGTYVFLTDDSGIGGGHLKPSIGYCQVELLQDLLVRLIAKYAVGS